MKYFFTLFCFLLVPPVVVFASELKIRSDIEFEIRQFDDDEKPETFENQRSLKAHLEGEKGWNSADLKFSANYRHDDQDPARDIFWLEDAYIQYQFSDRSRISFGTRIFNHSYMEVFHSLDVGNARIIDLSPLGNEKIGEPAISWEQEVFGGDFIFSYLPFPAAPILPGKRSRLNLPQNFNSEAWLSKEGEVDGAGGHFIATFEKSFDNFDLLTIISKNFDRSRLTFGTINFVDFLGTPFPLSLDSVYTPNYFERYLLGLTSVYNFESFQLKASYAHIDYISSQEVLVPRGDRNDLDSISLELLRPRDHNIWTLGAEKSFSIGDLSLVLVAEYQFVDASQDDIENFALQNDLFFALRLDFNDIDNKSITISSLFDLQEGEGDEGLVQIYYTQRIGSRWKVELSLVDYFIAENEGANAFALLNGQENISLKLKYFF